MESSWVSYLPVIVSSGLSAAMAYLYWVNHKMARDSLRAYPTYAYREIRFRSPKLDRVLNLPAVPTLHDIRIYHDESFDYRFVDTEGVWMNYSNECLRGEPVNILFQLSGSEMLGYIPTTPSQLGLSGFTVISRDPNNTLHCMRKYYAKPDSFNLQELLNEHAYRQHEFIRREETKAAIWKEQHPNLVDVPDDD